MQNPKDISRIDSRKSATHGWYVRVRYQGKLYCKFFSDGVWNGKYSALDVAIDWRNDKEKEIGKPRTDRRIVCIPQASPTSTGKVGVRLDAVRQRYVVSWCEPNGTQKRTTISISAHGKQRAFEHACRIREQKNNIRLGVQA